MNDNAVSRPDRRDAAAIAGLWVPYLLLAHYFWWLCDDAFISFRYARNWVAGHGLRYNLGDHPPVEGYSNFLWVVVASIFEWLGWDPVTWVPVVSLVAGMVLLALVYRFLLRRVGLSRPVSFLSTLTLATFPPFAVWSTSGLETMPFALAIFVTFDLLVAREEPRPVVAAVVALVVCLLRTEGIAWALVLAMLAVLAHARSLRTTVPYLKYVAIVVAGFLVYFMLRYGYYGLPFPNPVYTKVKFSEDVARRGFRYVATFFVTFLTPFLIVPAAVVAFRSRGARMVPVILMAIAFPAYAIVVGGDWMTMGRFLVPGLAFQTVLFGQLLSWLWGRKALAVGAVAAILLIGLLPGFDVHLAPESMRQAVRFRYFNAMRTEAGFWREQKGTGPERKEGALALKRISKPGDSLVYGAIGVIGYYTDLFIYDRFGLVTREVALLPRDEDAPLRAPGHDLKVSRSFFLTERPTFIAHARYRGGYLGEKVELQLREWQELLGPRLQRSYAPDFVEVDGKPDAEADDIVMVLRLIEEAPDDPVLQMPRPERRRERAARARELWDHAYERVAAMPGHMPQSSSKD